MAEKKISNEQLAKMINRGFEKTTTKDDLAALETRANTRFDKIEKRLRGIENRLPVNAVVRLEQLEEDVKAIKKAIGMNV